MDESLRVLVADDHGILRRGVIDILREAFPGVDVAEAGDGGVALQRCLSESWDVVILDISLPKLSGLEVLRQVKEHKPDLRVLMLSMYWERRYVLMARELGAAGYLGKQTTPDELEPAIRAILNGDTYVSHAIDE